MPVADNSWCADDWCLCEICGKDKLMSKFVAVRVDNENEGAEHEARVCYICKSCREKARKDPEYDKYITDIVFRLKLGRRIKE